MLQAPSQMLHLRKRFRLHRKANTHGIFRVMRLEEGLLFSKVKSFDDTALFGAAIQILDGLATTAVDRAKDLLTPYEKETVSLCGHGRK